MEELFLFINFFVSTSTEARIMREYKEQLQKASKVWDKMLEDSVKVNQALEKSGAFEHNGADNASVFSEKEIIGVSGKSYGVGVYLDSTLLTGLTEDERKGMVKEYVTTELAGEHFVAYDSNKDAVDVRIATKSESFKNEKGKKRNVLKELYNKYNGFTIKQEAVVLIDELIANAKFESPSQAKHKHGWLDDNGKNDWDIWTVFIQEKNKSVWEATLNIANTTNGEKILYDIDPIKMVEQASKSAKSTTNNIILNSDKNVNTKISDKTISVNMNEDERYEILKDKKITLVPVTTDEAIGIDFKFLENNIKSVVEKGLLKKFQQLGIFKKYHSLAIKDVYFDFTGKGFRKSIHSQENDYGGNKADFAKVLLNLQNLLDSSILIESHTDKGKGTSREKRGLETVYVLLGALKDGDVIVPVQFEVEQYLNDENRLYLAVALTKIETGVKGNTAPDEQKATSLLPISNVSISDIFNKINPIDKNFLKYVPNQFLNEEQIKAKNEALEIEKRKYSNGTLFSDKEQTTKMETEANVRYSEKNSYNGLFEVPSEVEEKLSNQIDIWLQGKMPSNEVFKLGKTSVVLKELGADDLPIVMAQDVISKINGVKHEVSLENIRNLPRNIADPIMIFKSATVPNAFVILTEMEDMSGRPIMAALHLNKAEKHIRVNRITSVYGKDGIKNFITSQTKLGNLKYIDKIKSQNWSQSRGLQLPKLADTNPDNNIILYKEDIVNTYNMRNGKELFSDKEQTSTYDLMGEKERLPKENEKYKADVERLKERLKIEKTLTHGNRFNENQLGTVAGHLRNISNSTYDKLTLMRELKDVYSYIITSEALAWEDVFGRCYRVAENMLKESKPEKVIDDYSKHILRNIRSTKIRLSDVQTGTFEDKSQKSLVGFRSPPKNSSRPGTPRTP